MQELGARAATGKMGAPKSSSPSLLLIIFVSSFLLFSSVTHAFNITRLLGRFPDFSTFNDYLTQTNVSLGINHRQTITVLVVENGAMSPVSGKPIEDLKNIMRMHVILDYYDLAKLHKLSNKTALLTTLFQASGQATQKEGFLNVTQLSDGDIFFGSAVSDAPHQSKLMRPVAAQPFNISVLQISTPVLAVGVGGVSSIAPVVAPPDVAPFSPPPSEVEAPAPSDDSADAPEADSPVADAPAPDADGPAADAPLADAPAGDAPFSSPPKPAADEPAADAPAKAGATQVTIATALAAFIPFVSILLSA